MYHFEILSFFLAFKPISLYIKDMKQANLILLISILNLSYVLNMNLDKIEIQNKSLLETKIIEYAEDPTMEFDGDDLKEKIKIAVIDSGVNFESPVISEFRGSRQDFSQETSGHHGTHVAGIIALNLSQSLGPWASRNIEINSYGKAIYFQEADYLKNIKNAIKDGNSYINISLAWSDEGKFIQEEYNLFKDNEKVMFFVAAGNSNLGGEIFPCAYQLKNVICVGNKDPYSMNRIKTSNYGPYVDLWANGKDSLSFNNRGEYHLMSGTSQASPLALASFVSASIYPESFILYQNKVYSTNDKIDLEINKRTLAGEE